MLKKISLIGAFFIVCSTGYAQTMSATPAEQAAASGPQFSLTNNDNVFDFGMIEEGDVVKHEFLFTNKGSAPLIVSNIHTDVRNASFRWPSRMIKPGKTGIITVTYKSFMDVGDVAGDILVTTNASKDPMPALHIKGKVMTYEESIQEPLGKSASK